jgi:hypothetical protein
MTALPLKRSQWWRLEAASAEEEERRMRRS